MFSNRDQIISNMCFTFRHDYGINKNPDDILSSGMTDEERNFLWNRMAQIFDDDIYPNMEFRKNNK